jgi:hypothetical protein
MDSSSEVSFDFKIARQTANDLHENCLTRAAGKAAGKILQTVPRFADAVAEKKL